MRLTTNVVNAINQQISMEFVSAYIYLAMSAYCERKNFTGSASWLRAQSAEEREHAMKLYEFLVDRGARIELLAIPAPETDYDSLHDIFRKALENEEKVSDSINQLYALALEEKAYATAAELQWFLTEQVEEEKTARQILSKLDLIAGDGPALLDLDREMGQRAAAVS